MENTFFLIFFLLFSVALSQTSVFGVASFSKISDSFGNLNITLADNDQLGIGFTSLGDLNGDMVIDIAVGIRGAGGTGEVYILFLNPDGSVSSSQGISNTAGNLGQTLEAGELFGFDITTLEDLNDDGVVDIMVGSPLRGGIGAAYTLLLNTDGTVNASTLITTGSGGFTETLDAVDEFGFAVGSIGDLNQDGICDAAISALLDDDGAQNAGAIYIVFLSGSGVVLSHTKISSTVGGTFPGPFTPNLRFGHFITAIGDLNGDDSIEIAVGAPNDDDGGTDRGSFYVLFLTVNGTLSSVEKISDTEGNFLEILDDGDAFGRGGAGLGDINGDSIPDLAVSAPGDDDGGNDRGAFYTLFFNSDGTIFSTQKISGTVGGFAGMLDDNDQVGWTLSNLGDFNGDGTTDVMLSSRFDDDGGPDRGAVYLLNTLFVDCPAICMPGATPPLTSEPIPTVATAAEDEADPDGLSDGEISAIVLGIFFFCLLMTGIIAACFYEYKTKQRSEPQDTDFLFYNSNLARQSLPNKTPNLAHFVEEKRKSQMPPEDQSTSDDDDSSSTLEEANQQIKKLKEENRKLKEELSSRSASSDSSSN